MITKNSNKQTIHRKGLPERRSIRLNGYDYSLAGLYFVTICCHDKICRFGRVDNEEMVLNQYGQIAQDEWLRLSERFPNFELDVFQIMPNHIHGIVVVAETGIAHSRSVSMDADVSIDCNGDLSIDKEELQSGPSPYTTLADIVAAYKSLVSNACLRVYKSNNESMGKFWQRNYFEHIIRNEQSYQSISDYIISNPANWSDDTFYNP